jgi:molecular chaperone HscC
VIVGIDLGTTNSAAAVWRDGETRLIPNSLGQVLTPSAVSLDENGELLVGMAARDRQSTHPQRTATAFKRLMGTQRGTKLGGRNYTPEELSAMVLRSLKADAEAFLGEAVTEAVIAVPAYFNNKQRKATRKAGELAGLKVERLINEPTAAALAYGLHERDREVRFLVFDLGGGTFDVSILELFEGVIEVRATTGDNRLGGEDFNDLIVQRLRKAFEKELGGDTWNGALHQKVRAAAERGRRALSEADETTLRFVWNDEALELPLTTTEFEAWAEPLLTRLREPVMRAMRDGGARVEQLDEIVMVGGATRMPVVRRAVTRMFGRFPAYAVDPEEAVARGAAIQAGLKARDTALNEVVLTDVCPYSLGVDVGELEPGGNVRNGYFAPIIERNTVVPASRVRSFYNLQDNQAAVAFNVYQGESRMVADNINLGAVNLPIPRGKRGEIEVQCRFSYDINGLLEVDVTVPRTGEKRQLVLADGLDTTSAEFEERRRLLAALKVHPREADANRAALARIGRCYEDSLGPTREAVGHLAAWFEQVLDRQEPHAIDHARAQLLAELDRLEGEPYL